MGPLCPLPPGPACTCHCLPGQLQAGLQEEWASDGHSGPERGDIQHSHSSPSRAVPHPAQGTCGQGEEIALTFSCRFPA